MTIVVEQPVSRPASRGRVKGDTMQATDASAADLRETLTHSPLARFALGLSILATWALAGFHLLMLVGWNSPPNPIRTYFKPAIDSYVLPLLYQSWSFFAPTPVSQDQYLIARAWTASGKRLPDYNISLALIGAMQRNRLTSKELLNTGISNAMSEAAENKHLSYVMGNASVAYRERSTRFLYRFSASFIEAAQPSANLRTLQIVIANVSFPRFANRFDKEGASSVDVNVFPKIDFPSDVKPLAW